MRTMLRLDVGGWAVRVQHAGAVYKAAVTRAANRRARGQRVNLLPVFRAEGQLLICAREAARVALDRLGRMD